MKSMLAISALALAVAGSAPGFATGPEGAKLFKARCSACHWDPAKADEKPRPGPSLKQIAGKAAGATTFRRYSAALKGSDITWNASTLDAYLENPRKAVKGTTMAFPGLRKPDERAAVVQYLLRHSK
ncbi:MAG: c-type cytochrome [Pacificimonas sp.]